MFARHSGKYGEYLHTTTRLYPTKKKLIAIIIAKINERKAAWKRRETNYVYS